MKNPEQLLIAKEALEARRAEQKRKRQQREEAQRIGNQVADQVRARREAAARRRG